MRGRGWKARRFFGRVARWRLVGLYAAVTGGFGLLINKALTVWPEEAFDYHACIAFRRKITSLLDAKKGLACFKSGRNLKKD